MSALRRWSEDGTVGWALVVAGIVILVVQVAPGGLVALLTRLWPLAIVAIGVGLLLGRRSARS